MVTLMDKSKAKASIMDQRGCRKEALRRKRLHHPITAPQSTFPHLGTEAASLKTPSLALCLQGAHFNTPFRMKAREGCRG